MHSKEDELLNFKWKAPMKKTHQQSIDEEEEAQSPLSPWVKPTPKVHSMNLDGYLVLHPMKESEHAVSVTTSNKQISLKAEPSKKAILTKV